MNCTRDGVVVECSWSEWKPRRSDFKKSASRSSQIHTAPLRAPLTYSAEDRWCEDPIGISQFLLLLQYLKYPGTSKTQQEVCYF